MTNKMTMLCLFQSNCEIPQVRTPEMTNINMPKKGNPHFLPENAFNQESHGIVSSLYASIYDNRFTNEEYKILGKNAYTAYLETNFPQNLRSILGPVQTSILLNIKDTVEELLRQFQQNQGSNNRFTYTIFITTGSQDNAGTTAGVYVILNGDSEHQFERVELENKTLERGTKQTFYVKLEQEISPAKSLVIGHDDSGDAPDWFCEKVDLKCHTTGFKQTFPCNDWLSSNKGDCLIKRKLKPTRIQQSKQKKTDIGNISLYDITVTTGDNDNAGTSAEVFIELHGESNITSGKLPFPRGKFDRGKSHKFLKVLPVMLSPLKSVDIGHDNSGESPDWYCEQVIVYSHTTGFKQMFACQKWVRKNDKESNLRTKLFENTELSPSNIHKGYNGMFQYDITITTGRHENAGTDANTFITLFGTAFSSRKLPLSHFKLDPGSSVRFHRDVGTYLGVLHTIEIGHDNSGSDPDWFLEKVTVYCDTTNTKQVFHCQGWLTKIKGDCSTVRILHENRDINNEVLRDMCKQHGRKSIQIAEACKDIRRQILSFSPSFKDVWPTHRPAAPDSIVFVVFTENESDRNFDLPECLKTFDIVYRNIGEYSKEDMEICKTEEHRRFGNKKDENHLTHILQKNSCHYMNKHSNLNIMTASAVKSTGFALGPRRVEKIPCIVFTVRVKGLIPIQEDELPSMLGTYKTDVREGGFVFYNDPSQYLERLKIGCSIGKKPVGQSVEGYGTLGAFVDLKDGNVGCITSAHVLNPPNDLSFLGSLNAKYNLNPDHSKIYQPAPALNAIDNAKPFGYVSSSVYKKGEDGSTGVEVCLITITDRTRIPDSGKFPCIAEDYTEGTQLMYTSGEIYTGSPDDIGECTVYKYGAKTGLTRGAFKLKGGAVSTGSTALYSPAQISSHNCVLHNQIEICSLVANPFKPFADHGDSGSLVFLGQKDRDLCAIGILTGGATNGEVFYVTPIQAILKALELDAFKLKELGPVQMNIDDGNLQIHMSVKDNKKIEQVQKEVKNVDEKVGKFEDKLNTVEHDIVQIKGEVINISSTMTNMNNMTTAIFAAIQAQNTQKKS